MIKRKICIVVASRANYGRIKSVLKAIKDHDKLELQIVVGASALLHRFGKVVDIIDFEEEYLKIFSREILEQIREGKSGWEKYLPKGVASLIKKNKMFGIKS